MKKISGRSCSRRYSRECGFLLAAPGNVWQIRFRPGVHPNLNMIGHGRILTTVSRICSGLVIHVVLGDKLIYLLFAETARFAVGSRGGAPVSRVIVDGRSSNCELLTTR
jgi:hypothetical protein